MKLIPPRSACGAQHDRPGGKKLDVRWSFGPFGRTQTWVRVQ